MAQGLLLARERPNHQVLFPLPEAELNHSATLDSRATFQTLSSSFCEAGLNSPCASLQHSIPFWKVIGYWGSTPISSAEWLFFPWGQGSLLSITASHSNKAGLCQVISPKSVNHRKLTTAPACIIFIRPYSHMQEAEACHVRMDHTAVACKWWVPALPVSSH